MTATLTPQRRALKLAFRELIRAVGGFEAAANYARVGKSMLHRYADDRSPENATCFAPIDVVAALEEVARDTPDWPQVTRAQAIGHGIALVTLPEPAVGAGDWMADIGRLSAELGEAVQRLLAALADGKICSRDVRELQLIRECDDPLALIVNIRSRLEAIAAGG